MEKNDKFIKIKVQNIYKAIGVLKIIKKYNGDLNIEEKFTI